MNLKTKLKSQQTFTNLVVYGIGQGFNLVTPLLVIPYIIHVCGLANYGKAAFGMALTFFLIVFIDYGSDISGVKAIATSRDNAEMLEKTFAQTYAAKAVILVAILIIMTTVFVTIPYFKSDADLFLLGLPILVGQFLNPTWFLQGVEKFSQITVLNILSKIIYVAGIFLFVTKPSDYIYINLWWGIGMIVANGISLIHIIKTFRFSFHSVTRADVQRTIQDNFAIFYSQIFVSVQLYAPLLLIGFFGGTLLAGMYRVVDQVIVIFKTYILLFFNFMYPRVCFLLGHEPAKGQRFWMLYNGSNFVFILFSMVAIFIFSGPVVGYFTHENAATLAALLRIAVLIPLVMAISIPLKQMLLGCNFQQFYVRVTVALVVSNLLLIVGLMPFFHIYGVLFSMICIEVLTALIFFMKIKNRLFLH